MKYEIYFKQYLARIEKLLGKLLPKTGSYPPVLHEAMRYAVLGEGKRFRPVLALAACEAVGGDAREALYPAAAIELVHAYSLVHDDLPALDNDDLRRGKPTCHKKFGEAIGIMTGDALLTLAFQVISKVKPMDLAVKVLAELSTEAGSYGMIGGQVADLLAARENKKLDLPALDFISIHKTGKLIKASAVCGALAGNAAEAQLRRIRKFGELLGMAFQSVDDLLDGDGYRQLMTASAVREKARDLIAKAIREIRPLGSRAEKLHKLADFLIVRIPEQLHVSVD